MSNSVGRKFARLSPVASGKITELTLPEILGAKEDFAEKIRQLRILFIGAGAVGSPAMLSFAQLQVEAIHIVDPKRYREESIFSQLADRSAVGQFKAEYRAGICKSISPATEVAFYNGMIQDIDLSELSGINLIILAGDNLTCETYAAQIGLWLRCPLIHGSVHAETTVSHVKTFANHDGTGPCPACLYNEIEWSQANGEVEYSCEPGNSRVTSPRIRTIPTRCLPNTSLNCGSTVATQAQKLMGGFGPPVGDTIHEFCGHTGKSSAFPLKRNPDCPLDHDTRLQFMKTDREFGLSSIGGLAEEGGIPMDASYLTTIGGFDWVDPLTCPKGHRNGGRFLPIDHHPDALMCCVCGGSLDPLPFSRRDSAATESLGSAVGTPLSDLGPETASWIKIRGAEKTVIFTPQN